MGLACGGKKACCQAGAGHAIRQQFGPVARIDADPKGRGLHKRGAGECQRLFPDVADGPGLFHMAGRYDGRVAHAVAQLFARNVIASVVLGRGGHSVRQLADRPGHRHRGRELSRAQP